MTRQYLFKYSLLEVLFGKENELIITILDHIIIYGSFSFTNELIFYTYWLKKFVFIIMLPFAETRNKAMQIYYTFIFA